MRGEQGPGIELLREIRHRFGHALLFAFFITAACNLAAMAVPLYCMELYNIVLNTRSGSTLAWLSVGLAVAMGVFGALDYLRTILYDAMADRAARRLTLPTLLAAAQAPEEKLATVSSEALRDLGEIRSFVSGTAVSVPLDLVWMPFLLAILFVMHAFYGLFALVCAAMLFALGAASDLFTRGRIRQANDETVRSFAEVSIALRNAEVVEALGMLPDFVRRWRNAQNRMLSALWTGTRRTKGFTAAIKACRLLMTGGMVVTGLVLCIHGEVSAGSLVASNMLLARLLAPFEQLVASWRAWITAGEAWNRVTALLTDEANRRGTLALPCRTGHLVVERLVYIPPGIDRAVLRGISFELLPGEVLGVVGPSGAGKSTLARLVVGAVPPTSGGVWLDGHSTWQWERGDFGRHVGYMPQTTAMLEGSIADNIARMRDCPPREVIAAARRVGLHEAIMALPSGYATPIGEAGFILSGGQRQRLALARALFGRPKLLVLDEPNSNLDEAGEGALHQAVGEARRDGAAVLLIVHRPSMVALADRLLILRDGTIDQIGGRDQLLPALQAPGTPTLQAVP